MPKRSAEEKIERYQRKIKKLTEEKGQRRRIMRIFDSDSSDNEGGHGERILTTAQVHDTIEVAPATPRNPPMDPEPVSPVEPVELPVVQSSLEQEPQELAAPQEAQSEQTTEGTTSEMELDPELLQALGELTDDSPDFGEKIHENLSKLWTPLLKKGMPKENKTKILKEYLVPDNCRLLQAPKLNAEISAAVPDMVRIRDKVLTTNQQQLGCGMTAINRALDLLLKGDDKKQAIQHLSNSCRILADLHSTLTQNRVKLVMPSLDKSFLHVVQDSERDDTLFGNKLSEKIKAAKAIERQGLQIKKPSSNQKGTNNSQISNTRPPNSGNWSAQPRYQPSRGGRGGWKKPAPPRRTYQSPSQTTPKSAVASKPRTTNPTTQ